MKKKFRASSRYDHIQFPEQIIKVNFDKSENEKQNKTAQYGSGIKVFGSLAKPHLQIVLVLRFSPSFEKIIAKSRRSFAVTDTRFS